MIYVIKFTAKEKICDVLKIIGMKEIKINWTVALFHFRKILTIFQMELIIPSP
jgi:hypothetical protein